MTVNPVDRTPVDCKTVLVVDDDRDIRDVLTDALEAEGYCVVTAADGQEALDWLRKGIARPCVILLDLMMPHEGGMTVIQHLRTTNPALLMRVAILTATPPAAPRTARAPPLPR